MFFGRVVIVTNDEGQRSVALDSQGVRYFADAQNRENIARLKQLGEQNADITVVSGEVDNDIEQPARGYPGGFMTLNEFYEGHLTWDAAQDSWRKPDGTLCVADVDLTRN